MILKISPKLTGVDIESKLGLKRGDVKELTTEPDGTVTLDTKSDLTAAQQVILSTMFPGKLEINPAVTKEF